MLPKFSSSLSNMACIEFKPPLLDISKHQFVKPTKLIKVEEQMPQFQESKAHQLIIAFLSCLNETCKGKKKSDPCHESEFVSKIIGLLDILDGWIADFPPIKQPMRYGNKAFRQWMKRLVEEANTIVENILPDELKPASIELCGYFVDSFGNATRIDYGTGHETTFIAFLVCLAVLGLVKEKDYQALVLRVFSRYVDLMRKLQMTYMLEPAGTHGVWSLDDYCFIPFYWGASQLLTQRAIKPRSVLNEEILDAYSTEYLYLDAIKFISKMKTGPFAEHSPILYDVSGVPNWGKVNGGMMKMYKVEVLSKFPIMQHFLFGSLITMDPA